MTAYLGGDILNRDYILNLTMFAIRGIFIRGIYTFKIRQTWAINISSITGMHKRVDCVSKINEPTVSAFQQLLVNWNKNTDSF